MDFEQELKSYSNFPKYSNFLVSTCTYSWPSHLSLLHPLGLDHPSVTIHMKNVDSSNIRSGNTKTLFKVFVH